MGVSENTGNGEIGSGLSQNHGGGESKSTVELQGEVGMEIVIIGSREEQ